MTASVYIIPYSVLMPQAGLETQKDAAVLQVTREQLLTLIRKLLLSVPVDEAWYRNTYPDVNLAIEKGVITSAKEHFVTNGYFEDRLPSKIVVDEEFYTSKYPDVAEGIDDGEMTPPKNISRPMASAKGACHSGFEQRSVTRPRWTTADVSLAPAEPPLECIFSQQYSTHREVYSIALLKIQSCRGKIPYQICLPTATGKRCCVLKYARSAERRTTSWRAEVQFRGAECRY